MKIYITDAEYPDDEVEREVLGAHGMELTRLSCATEDDVVAQAADADALIVQYAPITRRVLAGIPRLKVVSRYGTGYDNVDVHDAAARGIAVCNVPRYGTDEVAMHTLSLMLAAVREHGVSQRARCKDEWPPVRSELPQNPRHLTVGIVGAGHIGRQVIELVAPIFGGVSWFDPFVPAGVELGASRCATLHELARSANLISVHLPLTGDTRGLIDSGVFELLRQPAYFVNAARGPLVKADDLMAAIDGGLLRSAGLDVFDIEPIPASNPILQSSRTVVTPHTAWASPEALIDIRRTAAQNVVAALLGVGDAHLVPLQLGS